MKLQEWIDMKESREIAESKDDEMEMKQADKKG